MTQSQLAERVGVSPQAISKWENGTGYPDVSLIIPLAKALQISTDELFEHKDTLCERKKQWQLLRFKIEKREASWGELIKLDNEILQDFPNDETFLYRRMCDELFAARSAKSSADKKRWLARAEAHGTEVVDQFPNFDSAKGMLVDILMESGKKDLAIHYAHKCKDPDQVMKRVLSGDELRRHRQRIIEANCEGYFVK